MRFIPRELSTGEVQGQVFLVRRQESLPLNAQSAVVHTSHQVSAMKTNVMTLMALSMIALLGTQVMAGVITGDGDHRVKRSWGPGSNDDGGGSFGGPGSNRGAWGGPASNGNSLFGGGTGYNEGDYDKYYRRNGYGHYIP